MRAFFIGFWNGTSANKRQPRVQGNLQYLTNLIPTYANLNFPCLYVFTCKTCYYCLFDQFDLVFFFVCINSLTVSGYLQYTIAMMGYGPEDKFPVLELTYNYGVTEYDKGNAYAQVREI